MKESIWCKFKIKSMMSSLAVASLLSAQVMAGTVQDIPAAINLYISPEGRSLFENNIQSILTANNFDISSYRKNYISHETGEKAVEELIPDNRQLTDLIKRSKRMFTEFFYIQGNRLRNTHNIKAEAEDIRLTTNFRRIGVDFHKDSYQTMADNGVRFELQLELTNFLLTVQKARVEDLMHSFFSNIGVDGVRFGMESDSVPLRFSLPLKAKVSGGRLRVEVGEPRTNLEDIELYLDYDNLVLPSFTVTVNGHRGRADLREVERLLRSKHSDLLTGLKQKAQEFVDQELGNKLDEQIEKAAYDSFNKWTDMEPLGTDDSRARQMRYKLKPNLINYKGDHLWVSLNADIRDRTERVAMDDKLTATTGVSERSLDGTNYDIAVALNQGFVNKLLTLSDRRGLFDHIETEGGTRYELSQMPELRMVGRNQTGQGYKPAIHLKVWYNQTGPKKIFVNNPILVEFDLNIDVRVKQTNDPARPQRVEMFVTGVDYDDAYVARRYSRWETLWPEVLEAARETLQGMQSDLRGMVLAEDIPLPHDLLGFPMTIKDAKTDVNGHILLFMDYN